MATLILRPISDTSLQHTCSSGSNGYSMISETSSDGDSTYVYQSLTSTTSSSLSSTFSLGKPFSTSQYNVTAVRFHFYARDSDNNVTSSASVSFNVNGSGAYTVSANSLTTRYSDYNQSNADMVAAINGYLSSGEIPIITATLKTTGRKSNNNKSDGYIRVTQIYIEVDYEEATEKTPSIYIKDDVDWKEYRVAYKKVGNAWVQQLDFETLFDENTNYVRGN